MSNTVKLREIVKDTRNHRTSYHYVAASGMRDRIQVDGRGLIFVVARVGDVNYYRSWEGKDPQDLITALGATASGFVDCAIGMFDEEDGIALEGYREMTADEKAIYEELIWQSNDPNCKERHRIQLEIARLQRQLEDLGDDSST